MRFAVPHFLIALLVIVFAFDASARGQAIDLQDGDRVILLGGALIERDIEHCQLEAFLTAGMPERNVVFRNLGWSGDTVWAEARAGFDSPVEGFARMREQIAGLKPTWIVVAYGANEAFAGRPGLANFATGMNRLLDALAETGAKLALVTPHLCESLGAPLPNADTHNEQIRAYAAEIRRIAGERKIPLIDLHERLTTSGGRPLTYNGIHLGDYGYWRYAVAMGEAFAASPADWRVELNARGGPRKVEGTRIEPAESNHAQFAFTALDATLPCPPCPAGESEVVETWPGSDRTLVVSGLPEGRYELAIDGQPITTGTAADFAAGVQLQSGPEFAQLERLRATARQKNEFYFHRWRPQNDTYLLGFRKYEQGQNAIEIPQFDPLVAEQEAAIASLRKPVPHRYSLSLVVRPAVEAEPAN